jgi:hypothetical protein
MPDPAIDDCERSHEAANGRKQKADADKFDDTYLFCVSTRT